MLTEQDLKHSLPKLDGVVRVDGLTAKAEVYRDAQGVPHVRAANEQDAFFAQGFVAAQDRLWQMEYDRRRAAGRWAEVVGASAVGQDKMMRRFRLESAAQADYQAVEGHTRMMLEAYAVGVNAFIRTTSSLPVEYGITGLEFEPWEPWHGLLVFKVRHIFMGVFESKLWRARMVAKAGPEAAARLSPGRRPGQLLILPPGEEFSGPLEDGLEELQRSAAALGYLNDDGGSNSWAISGERTASGKPLLAGDPHRALDTPNVYYQNHVACPEFDVTGLSFAGLPGFHHFGHNEWVAWCVTHTGADYQDLYIERFNPDDPCSYLDRGEWRRAAVHRETIKVKDGDDVAVDVWVTRHGPVISGGPEQGSGIAFKYTATEGPSNYADVLWQMLRAKDATELAESMRDWVDPCNNLLFADVHGNIGYLCRGRVPIRPRDNGWLPAPGWTGEQEWQGYIPFDEMPRSINPKTGYIVTANNSPVGDDYPHYLGVDFAPDYRARSVTEGLLGFPQARASDMAEIHARKVSIPALTYVDLLQKVQPLDEVSASARERLLAWDGSMDVDGVEPALYSVCRDFLLKQVLEHNLGPELANEAWRTLGRGPGAFLGRLKAQIEGMIAGDDRGLLPPGEDWAHMMAEALKAGVADLQRRLGENMEEWRWGRLHQALPRHTLSSAYPELAGMLDPPAMPTSGDGDTPLAGSYLPGYTATIVNTSAARYVYDLADWDNSQWVVPLGSSGHPGSEHYHDQSQAWLQVRMFPMLYSWDRIIAESKTRQTLEPG